MTTPIGPTGIGQLLDGTKAEGGRSRERYRRAAFTFIASIIVKAIALLTLFASVPLGLGYLGSERFGLWMTASSAIGLSSFVNLGFDKGLLNALAAAHGRGCRAIARRLVSTAFFLLGGIFAVMLALFTVAYPLLPWARLLNATGPAVSEAGPLVAVLIGCALLALLANLVDTVQSAYQEGFRNGMWEAAGKISGLGALVGAIEFDASLPVLALGVAGAPLLASLANAIVLFGRRRPWLLPRLRLVQHHAARQLFSAGSLFFLSQLALTVAYYADNLIIAQLAGGEAVTTYAVTARLFDFPGMLLLIVGGALWPPLVEAIARGDVAWAESGLRRFLLVSLGFVAMTALPLIPLGPIVLRWWVGNDISPPTSLFAAFGLFWMLSALTQPISVFLNAASALRFQLACLVGLAAGGLATKLFLAQIFGVAGVAWGRVVAEVIFLLLPYVLFMPRLLRRLRCFA